MKHNFIELSSVIASVKVKEDTTIIQLSDAGATLTLSVKDWEVLKKYVAKQL